MQNEDTFFFAISIAFQIVHLWDVYSYPSVCAMWYNMHIVTRPGIVIKKYIVFDKIIR